MGLRDRLRHSHHDDPHDPEDGAVRGYRVALRSASPAVIVAAHVEALRGLDPADVAELRRRLDLRLSHPTARGDASVEAVAADLAQLATTGAGAVFRLVEGQDEGAGAGSPVARHEIPVSDVALGFVSSKVWAAVSGLEPRHPGATADGEEQSLDQSAAVATAELHKLRNGTDFGIGTNNIGM